MNQSISKSRFIAFVMACLTMLSIFSGLVGPHHNDVRWGTPVAADGTVDDLWDEISADKIGGKLNADKGTDMNMLVSKAQSIAKTTSAILVVVCFVALLISISALATSAGNAKKRGMALTGILFSGIALALFGGAWVVVSFFWNILRP